MGVHLPFLEDFPVDYEVVSNHPSPKWSNFNDAYMLMVFLMEKVDREMRAKEHSEQKAKLFKYKED